MKTPVTGKLSYRLLEESGRSHSQQNWRCTDIKHKGECFTLDLSHALAVHYSVQTLKNDWEYVGWTRISKGVALRLRALLSERTGAGGKMVVKLLDVKHSNQSETEIIIQIYIFKWPCYWYMFYWDLLFIIYYSLLI